MAGPKFLAIFFFMLSLISVLPLLTFSFSPDEPTGCQILVLLDYLSLKSSHFLFFTTLQSRGLIAVKRYDQYLYDGLVLFSPPTDRFGGSLDMEGVLDFVDSGHDLILAADSNASDLIRNIAAECGVDFDEAPVLFKGIGYSLNPKNSLVKFEDYCAFCLLLDFLHATVDEYVFNS